jgi:hypothetical protein
MTSNPLTHRICTTYFNIKKLYIWSRNIFTLCVILRKNAILFLNIISLYLGNNALITMQYK